MEQKVKLSSGAEISVPAEVILIISSDEKTTSAYINGTVRQLDYSLNCMVEALILAGFDPADVIECITKSIFRTLDKQSLTKS